MKVLLADSDMATATELSRVMREAQHEVTLAADDNAAIATLVRGVDQALVVIARADGKDPLRLIKHARSLPHGPELYVLMLSRDLRDEDLLQAYEAGIDHDGPLATAARLLPARLRTAERWAGRPRRPLAPPPPVVVAPTPPEVPVETLPPVERVSRSKTWRRAESSLQGAAAKFLSMAVTSGPVSTANTTLAHATRIVLASTELQLELAVTVAASTKSCDSLAVAIFGETGPDFINDMLGEVANVLMGTLKTSLSGDTLPFTAGLPAKLSVEDVLRPAITFKQQESFVLFMGDASMTVHLGLRSRANERVAPHLLREGMVVAVDVTNARGLLLINKGTRLSANMVDRLRANLAAKSVVEVMAP